MRAATLVLVLVCVPALAAAVDGLDGGPGLWTSPEIRPFTLAWSASLELEPRSGAGEGAEYERATYAAGARGQVWHDAHDEIDLDASLRDAQITSDASFPDGLALPDRLYDRRVGVAYRHVRDDHTAIGISATVASANQRPFASADGTSVLATAFYRLPLRRDAWLFTLSWTDDAPVLNRVPIPGALYEWNPRPDLHALVGLPISLIIWRPSPRLWCDAAGTVFGTLRAGASTAPFATLPPLRAELRFSYGAETWKWPEELDWDQRVFLRSAKATLGMAWARPPGFTASLFGGWEFAREVLIGESVRNFDQRIGIDAGPVFGVALRASF